MAAWDFQMVFQTNRQPAPGSWRPGSSLRAGSLRAAVFADVTDGVLIAEEKTLDQIAPVFFLDDEKEILARSNELDSGLAACVYARDSNRSTQLTGPARMRRDGSQHPEVRRHLYIWADGNGRGHRWRLQARSGRES